MTRTWIGFIFFFFNDTATTEIYTLSLHDALPIFLSVDRDWLPSVISFDDFNAGNGTDDKMSILLINPINHRDRKSTRLNSSHANISYAVFCLKKKKQISHYDILTTTTKYYRYTHL